MQNDDDTPMKIVFAPGCFDNFEGTQEELDALQEEILAMFNSGEMMMEAVPVDFDELINEDPALAERLAQLMDAETPGRTLH